jgi:deazaflavin-dependent oxidoreductase (nitroreductase family)
MAEHEQAPRETGWQAEHAKRYIATDGEDGHMWNGVPTLLLTTKGARSGKPYTTPLIYGRDGERYLIVASIGGAPQHPQWYRNLVADPDVGIQVGAEKFNALARTATPEEKPPLWSLMASVYPAYEDMQKRTTRDIPVIIIERI